MFSDGAHTLLVQCPQRGKEGDEDLVGGEQRRVEGWVLTAHVKVTVGTR